MAWVLLVSAPPGLRPFVRPYEVSEDARTRLRVALERDEALRQVAVAAFNLAGPGAARDVLEAGRRA